MMKGKNMQLSSGDVRVTLEDLYSLLFSLSKNKIETDEDKKQIESIEKIIAYNITRKDVPAYSLQQTIELSSSDADSIFRDKKEDYVRLDQIRQNVRNMLFSKNALV